MEWKMGGFVSNFLSTLTPRRAFSRKMQNTAGKVRWHHVGTVGVKAESSHTRGSLWCCQLYIGGKDAIAIFRARWNAWTGMERLGHWWGRRNEALEVQGAPEIVRRKAYYQRRKTSE
ncbi:hypothetical protein MAPG_02123 [Magnaporthiopsis poae ATCC 64411]|uniref:Uncharacterized protein n=1 Tax=Magnaporthiopsis poae (strain ATCC 64411 / 73-15) TaxID=644358 RepID=A0A0C4DQI0_MAGP6|nr:hypothetical protein MAPG_02123 [Magnaporthiopsis poae ATCC 64411]